MANQSGSRRRAAIEWARGKQAGCLRVGGPDFDHRQRSRYDRACTVFRQGDTAVIKGWVGTPLPSHWRAVCECLAREGFERMVFERAINGRRHDCIEPLDKYAESVGATGRSNIPSGDIKSNSMVTRPVRAKAL